MANGRVAGRSLVVELWSSVAHAIRLITGPWTLDNLFSWVKLIVVVLTVWWFFLQPFRIPTGSMEPTLHGDPRFFVGDRVFVNKLAYGPRIPFSTKRLIKWGEPERFDIVVFRNVEAPQTSPTPWARVVNFLFPKILIKRVIGLPGEHVLIYEGQIYINGQPLELPDTMPEVEYIGLMRPRHEVEAEIRAENLSPEALERTLRLMNEKYTQAESMARRGLLQYGVIPDEKYSVVPKDCYFVLGDNSKDSADGRYFGWVPHDHLLGRAFCIWWPISRRRDLTGFTDTWWGLALLWGIPLSLVVYELARANLFVTMRVRRNKFLGVARRSERIFINRVVFGLRFPFTSWRVWPGRLPRRGEYVAYVVSQPHDGVAVAGEVLFGRVAGLPGDTVRVENGMLIVAEEPTGRRVDSKARSPYAPGRKNSKVPKDSVIVISDEDDAADSRVLGPIDRNDLIGKLSAVYWPPHRMRRLGPRDASPSKS